MTGAREPPGATGRFADAEPSGLATMLGGSDRAEPGRATPATRAAASSVGATIERRDAGVEVTSGWRRRDASSWRTDRIRRPHGADPRPIAGAARLVAAPLRFGSARRTHAEGRAVIARHGRGRVRIDGMVRHPRQVLRRLTMLLSAHEGLVTSIAHRTVPTKRRGSHRAGARAGSPPLVVLAVIVVRRSGGYVVVAALASRRDRRSGSRAWCRCSRSSGWEVAGPGRPTDVRTCSLSRGNGTLVVRGLGAGDRRRDPGGRRVDGCSGRSSRSCRSPTSSNRSSCATAPRGLGSGSWA